MNINLSKLIKSILSIAAFIAVWYIVIHQSAPHHYALYLRHRDDYHNKSNEWFLLLEKKEFIDVDTLIQHIQTLKTECTIECYPNFDIYRKKSSFKTTMPLTEEALGKITRACAKRKIRFIVHY